MRSKIEEMVFLYNKETKVEYNKKIYFSARRLTLDEVIENRKKAIKTLMEMPKSELVDYILGINNRTFLELRKIQNKEF
ncbi:MAG: hypothetical protein SPK49_01845 [Erysipelotrichaceae bacterium]|nr:hypothetical protein [Erysipelotrichaceae bacterium]